VPVTVTKAFPGVAEPLAVIVSKLVPVVGFGVIVAVKPLTSPDTARFTLPAKPATGFTKIVDVKEEPCDSPVDPTEETRVKAVGGIVRTRVAEAGYSAPDVPVMVTLYFPAGGAPALMLLSVRVSTLAPVLGFGVNDAPTPLGRPDAARFTLPVNPL
jgi:hypothetical protein